MYRQMTPGHFGICFTSSELLSCVWICVNVMIPRLKMYVLYSRKVSMVVLKVYLMVTTLMMLTYDKERPIIILDVFNIY